MIKAIIRKELRENYRLALAGTAILGFLISIDFDHSNPPLMNGDFQALTSFFCGIYGALLGWLQIRRENHPDLRAFLLHRPLSRTGIFFGKVIAGLSLYLLAAGLPLVYLTGLVLTPGRVIAPFDWEMTLPAASILLAGIVCYFAGMLAARQPQARWSICGVLALGAGILTLTWQFREFWQALLLVIASAAILGTAAWGCFLSSGNSRRESVAAGIALPLALMPGAVMLVLLSVLLFVQLVVRPKERTQYYAQTTYEVLADGTVAKLSPSGPFGGVKLTDTNGQFLTDPGTGKYIGADVLAQITAPATRALFLPQPNAVYDSFRDSSRFCQMVFSGPPQAWFYSFKRGRLLGYDVWSLKFVGSIGPEGFVGNLQAAGARFWPGTGVGYSQSALSDTHTVFNIVFPTNSGLPSINRYFSVPANDVIVTTAEIWSNIFPENISIALPNGVQRRVQAGTAATWAATAAVTSQFVYVVNPGGQVLWKLPRPVDFSGDASLQVCLLKSTGQCVLKVTPSEVANRKANGKLPTHLEFYDGNSTLAKTVDLPTFVTPPPILQWEAKCLGLLMPPMSVVLFGASFSNVFVFPAWDLLLSGLCAAAALVLGWRARLSARAQIGWVIFHLLTGVGGFLTFLCLQTRPAREPCPNCHKLRVVNRDRCEHCDAPFAPADKNGTEIFEPLGTPDSRPRAWEGAAERGCAGPPASRSCVAFPLALGRSVTAFLSGELRLVRHTAALRTPPAPRW